MSSQTFNEMEIAILFRDTAIGPYKRHKSSLKILYEIFRFIKWGKKQGYEEIYPGIERIAKNALCCQRQVQRFLKTELFKTLGECIHRSGQSSVYRLNDWVERLFTALERKGVMKNIKENFDKFHKRFKKFMDVCVIGAMELGHGLIEVLNKLCTKIKRICHPLPKEYVTLAYHSKLDAELPNVMRTKPVESNVLSQDVLSVVGLLKNRLNFSEQETRGFVFKNSLGIVKQSAETLCFRIEKLRWVPRNMARALQKLINDRRIRA